MKIIGRKEEIRKLNELYDSNKPEFVAVYGRRRVGKTFLVNEVFSSKFAFKHVALSPIDDDNGDKTTTSNQLKHFGESLKKYGYKGNRKISDWYQAFYALEELLEDLDIERKVIFIDELPWLDTKGSKFVSALESFWNSWANTQNILFIICGSATSWIIKNVLELQYAENRGAAFGIFQGRQLPITIISILIILFIVFMFEACPMIKRMIPLLVGYVVIMAGAIGNMIDRIVNGYVVDFIYFKLINFPNFNVADICVTCGCIYLVLLFIFYYKDGDNLTVFAKSKETDND